MKAFSERGDSYSVKPEFIEIGGVVINFAHLVSVDLRGTEVVHVHTTAFCYDFHGADAEHARRYFAPVKKEEPGAVAASAV